MLVLREHTCQNTVKFIVIDVTSKGKKNRGSRLLQMLRGPQNEVTKVKQMLTQQR